MQFTNAIFAIASMAALSTAATLPSTGDLVARQTLTLGQCASVSTTLQQRLTDANPPGRKIYSTRLCKTTSTL